MVPVELYMNKELRRIDIRKIFESDYIFDEIPPNPSVSTTKSYKLG
jgi:hypothetical protein